MQELPAEARRALDRARAAPFSYAVRAVRSSDGRLVVVLGEAHVKLARASEIGRAVVAAFELRGVETFQRKQLAWGRALGVVVQAPRALLRVLSLGAIRDSTIVDAKQLPSGYTVELERARAMPFGLHVTSVYMTAFFVVAFLAMLAPLIALVVPALAALILTVASAFNLHLLMLVPGFFVRRHPRSWLVHPFLGILTLRDALMADGTARMMADHPAIPHAVVVMGRAHVEGYTRCLVERHGYTRVPL